MLIGEVGGYWPNHGDTLALTAMTRRRFPMACAGVSAVLASSTGAASAADSPTLSPIDQRNNDYQQQLEWYFRHHLVDEYPARAAKMWRRSHTGVPAFLRSVEGNRRRYREMFAPSRVRANRPR